MSGKSEARNEGQDGRTETINWTEADKMTMTVVDTVSSVTDQEPTEMQPLGEIIDSEALETLFAGKPHQDKSHLQFEYEGCLIRVSGEKKVTVTPLE